MRSFLLLIALLASISAYSQKIKFYDNIEAGQAKAKQNKKPMFVMVGPPSLTTDAHPASMPKFKPGFEDKDVAEFYNSKFVNVRINLADSAVATFRKFYPYKIQTYPAYLFFDHNGGLLYKGISMLTSMTKPYTDMANAALTAASGSTISKYEALRGSGKLDRGGLKEYILLKQKLGLYDNAKLIDEYVDQMTVGSLNNYQEILFIMSAGPVAYGRTYMLCLNNRKLYDSLYKTEPLALRIAINNHIKENTRAEAIRTKNVNMAHQLASFSGGTVTPKTNYNFRQQVSSWELLNYYHQVKDTANYFNQATQYYDNYYMRLTTDSIKRLREKSIEAGRKASMETMRQLNPKVKFSTGIKSDSAGVVRRTDINTTTTLTSGPAVQDVPSILNNAAYGFYTFGTRNPVHLTKALLWVKRAISLSPDNHAYYDTMAHLLYRLDLVDEAILDQNKAIEMAEKGKISVTPTYLVRLRKDLEKMKQRTL